MLEITILYIFFSISLIVFLLFKGYKDWEIVFWSFVLVFGLVTIITRIFELIVVIIPAITIYAIYKYNVYKKTKKDENQITKEDLNDKVFDLNKSITLQEDIIRSKLIFFLYRNKKSANQYFNIESSAKIEKNICGHNVVYYDEPHKYYVDGVEIPSITEIVGVLAIYYGWDDYKQINSNILENAAKKGTILHKSIEQYERFKIEAETIEFGNYLKVKNEHGFKVVENEKIVILVINNKPVAIGRLDMIIELNNKFAVMEIKRTSKYYKEKVALQLNLYRLAYLQSYNNREIQALKVLRLYNSDIQFEDVEINEYETFAAIEKYNDIRERLLRDVI